VSSSRNHFKELDALVAIALARARGGAGGGAITVAIPGFVQPAVGLAVSIPVSSSAGANAPGAFLAVTLAGVANFYAIAAVPDGGHIVAVNLGGSNAPPATAFGAGLPVVPDAPVAPVGSAPTRLAAPTTLNNFQRNVYGDTSGGTFALTFPPAPTDGLRIDFFDNTLSWNVSNLLIDANVGQTVASLSLPASDPAYYGASARATVQGGRVSFEYDGVLFRWSP
jgi:hypothetical protein